MSYEELKDSFQRIEDRIVDKSIKKTVITLVDKYEKTWGKPVYTQELDEIQEMINREFAPKIYMSGLKFYAFRQFLKICEEHFHNTSNVYRYITLKSTNDLKYKMLRSPLHGKIFLDSVFPEKGVEATESTVVYQAYFWLVYMGILDVDICSLTTDDVDLENMKVYVNGIGYEIYNEAIRAIKACATEDQFEYIHPKYRTLIKRYPEDMTNKQLLHGVKGAAQIDTLKSAFSKINSRSVNASSVIQGMSYQDIRSSGLYYRAYIHELTTGNNIRFYDAAMLELGDEFAENRDIKIHRNQKYYLDKYIQWKLAFNLMND